MIVILSIMVFFMLAIVYMTVALKKQQDFFDISTRIKDIGDAASTAKDMATLRVVCRALDLYIDALDNNIKLYNPFSWWACCHRDYLAEAKAQLAKEESNVPTSNPVQG